MAAFLFIAGCLAQDAAAQLFGSILDPSGLPVRIAAVHAENQATLASFRVTSDDRGDYHLMGLPPGQYTLRVETRGFHTYRQSGIVLRAGDRPTLDCLLALGAQSQSIDVVADASLLQTTTGEVSFRVDRTRVESLPLDGRNFVPLIALAPGVALPGGGSLFPRINGSRPRTNEYIYDGISVLQPEPGQVAFYPIIDGIAEFRVNVNSYSPEYGRSNGGAVLVSGKAGTNTFHATLFEFFRNEALNARNYFASSGPKPVFRRNQYGFAAGGPIERNRTFFFADWQGSRLRTGITRFSTVPLDAQRAGIFAAPIYDPLTRTPFPNNTIPSNRFDPVAAQVLARYPSANLSGTANNYVRTAVEPDNQDQFDLRIDRSIGAKHRVSTRYSYFRDQDRPVTPLPDGSGTLTSGVIGNATTRGDGLAAEHTWTITPRLLNQARFGFTRRDCNQASLETSGLAIPGIPANSFGTAMPIFAVTGFQQIGPTANANSNFTTFVMQFADTVSMSRRRRTRKFGVDLRREALDNLTPPNPAGFFSFTNTGTNATGIATSGSPVASLLLGQVNSFSIDIQEQAARQRANIAEFFAGDDWRPTARHSRAVSEGFGQGSDLRNLGTGICRAAGQSQEDCFSRRSRP